MAWCCCSCTIEFAVRVGIAEVQWRVETESVLWPQCKPQTSALLVCTLTGSTPCGFGWRWPGIDPQPVGAQGSRVSTLAKCNVDNSVWVSKAEVSFPQIYTGLGGRANICKTLSKYTKEHYIKCVFSLAQYMYVCVYIYIYIYIYTPQRRFLRVLQIVDVFKSCCCRVEVG